MFFKACLDLVVAFMLQCSGRAAADSELATQQAQGRSLADAAADTGTGGELPVAGALHCIIYFPVSITTNGALLGGTPRCRGCACSSFAVINTCVMHHQSTSHLSKPCASRLLLLACHAHSMAQTHTPANSIAPPAVLLVAWQVRVMMQMQPQLGWMPPPPPLLHLGHLLHWPPSPAATWLHHPHPPHPQGLTALWPGGMPAASDPRPPVLPVH